MTLQRRRTPRVFYVFLLVFSLLLVEASARIFFSTQVGPGILLYGTPWHRSQQSPAMTARDKSPQRHRNDLGSYTKYFPREAKLIRAMDGKMYPARINNHGFRGPDFTAEKQPGVLRVLTLGASSTFGYQDRDDETYPCYLGQILNRRSKNRSQFEVINFGIPHATTANILSMFLAEGVQLQPDFVTLYAGANDTSAALMREVQDSRARQLWAALGRRLLVLHFLDYVLRPMIAPDPGSWSKEAAEEVSRVFLENVNSLLEECTRRDIRFIVATQQATSLMIKREQMRGLTYADEFHLVREKLARREKAVKFVETRGVRADEPKLPLGNLLTYMVPRIFLVHSHLMGDLREWAATNEVDLVDVIDVLDQDRHLLLSWVHLHPEANRMIAAAFAQKILGQVDLYRRGGAHQLGPS